MLTIVFYRTDGDLTDSIPLADVDDQQIEDALKKAEQKHGTLPRDDRTDFPCFTIFDEDGYEVAGG